jgi:hypothetical protein
MDNEKADKIINLLEQIRDLQQQGIENYRNAIRNQEESIAIQKAAARKFRNILFPVILIVLAGALVALFFVLRILLRYG